MKPYIRGADVGTWVWLDRDHATTNLRHFLNFLNRSLFGSSFRRTGKRVTVFPVLEGTATKHLHYHLAIDCPFPEGRETVFDAAVRGAWSATRWGDAQIHVTAADDGWIDYITKRADKSDFADAIDWTNAHLPG